MATKKIQQELVENHVHHPIAVVMVNVMDQQVNVVAMQVGRVMTVPQWIHLVAHVVLLAVVELVENVKIHQDIVIK
jgi:hypothetical protein